MSEKSTDNQSTASANIMVDPIDTSKNFTGSSHHDASVGVGTRVYAMCDGTFEFAYWYGRPKQGDDLSYISNGRGGNLIPDAGWQTENGRTSTSIQYGHLSELNGYETPTDYVENSYPSSYDSCHEKHRVNLGSKKVKAGDYIGKSGNCGNSTGAHLHIQL